MDYGSREYFRALAEIAQGPDAQRIYVGLSVVVTSGRKHRGRTGQVVRHTRSKFSSALRYASGASLDLRLMLGRSGFVALIRPADGSADFWIACEHLSPAPERAA